jgi:hypothetical protein
MSVDRYRGENILIHEFSHTMLTMGVEKLDPEFRIKLTRAYTNAIASKKWQNTYAATNVDEYWAEGVQDWFDCNLCVKPSNGIHNQSRPRLRGQHITAFC